MRVIRLTILIVLVACALNAQREITFSLPKTATSYEQRKTQEAVDNWNIAIKGVATLTLLPPGSNADWHIDFDTDKMNDMRGNVCETHHGSQRIHCNPRAFISRMDVPTPCNFQATMAHEIGHALGIMGHPGGLMRERCFASEHPVDDISARAAIMALAGH